MIIIFILMIIIILGVLALLHLVQTSMDNRFYGEK